MRKTLMTLSIITILLLNSVAFAAASGSQEKTGGDGVTTLKWALWDFDATTYYEPLISAYEAKNPNVKIEPVDLGSTDYMTMLSMQLMAGDSSLDVVTIKDMPGYNNLVKSKRLLSLNDYVASKSVDTAQYGGIAEQITVDSDLYALPFRSDFWLVYYNKDLFDAAGLDYPNNDMTMAEYDAIARKMTSGSGASKVYGAHYHTWRSAVQLFGILEGKQTILEGDYDFLKPYYQMILDEQADGIVQDYATLKTSSTHYSGVFYNNSIAMMNMGSWFISTQIAKVESGESKATNWGLAKYPHPEGVHEGTTLGTITTLGVSAFSKQQEAALDFLGFVTGPEGAAIIAETGTIPAIQTDEVVEIISSTPGFPSDDASKEALKVYQTYLEMPLHEKAGEIEVVLNQNHDMIMTNNISLDAGIAQMNKEVKEILGR